MSSILERLKIKNEAIEFQGIKILIPSNTMRDEALDIEKIRENLIKRKQEMSLENLNLYDPAKEPKKIKKIKKIGKRELPKDPELKAVSAIFKKSKKETEEDSSISDMSIDVMINDETIRSRLPKEEKYDDVTVVGKPYYMENKQVFYNFLHNLFEPYEKEINTSKPVTCDSLKEAKKGDFSLLVHQKIIKEYMRIYSPYRGLLLFHGLGAGKTCASIAISEGLKHQKKVFIMTPKSLQRNYVEQLKECGDVLWKLNQHWEGFDYDQLNEVQRKFLSKRLGLNVDTDDEKVRWNMKKKKKVWLVNVNKAPNYNELTPAEKRSIDEQILAQIMKKYEFIAYNGLRKRAWQDLITREKILSGNDNPFNNKVIIIDEAHNFVTRIVNKIKRKQTDSLSFMLYDALLKARNCKIVFLTGTPVINYPNEIAVLFNILRGNINTFHFSVNSSKTLTTPDIKKYLSKVNVLDYINYDNNPQGDGKLLTITRNPFNFKNYKEKKVYDKNIDVDDETFKMQIISELDKNGILARFLKNENHLSLPDDEETFKKTYIDSMTKVLKNPNKFKSRIIGLTSYFRSASESLLPKLLDLTVFKIPMKKHQFGIYTKARFDERKEKGSGKSSEKTSSSYRIFSRLFCNFVFPEGLERPKPDKYKGEITEDLVDNITVTEQIQKSEAEFDTDDAKKLYKLSGSTEQDKGVNINYQKRIEDSIIKLREGIISEETGKKIMPLKINGDLETHSPKFLKLLQTILSKMNQLHLIYSQFRTLEGVGIIKEILEQNGWAEFKIKKDTSDGKWKINMQEDDLRSKPHFCLYTGTEEEEEKEIIRKIYNSEWDKVDKSLTEEFEKLGIDNNWHGELIKVMMITSSGAEGINLQNVRNVHLIEPYWHPIRTEQVIGRARRICSHQSLPYSEDDTKNERTVDVYLYLMTFADEVMDTQGKKNVKKDKSKEKYDGEYKLLTTDEALWEICQIKERTNTSILTAIKESSIDCSIHSKSSGENLQCFGFNTDNDIKYSFIPDWGKEAKDDKAIKRDIEQIAIRVRPYPGKPNWYFTDYYKKKDKITDPNYKGDVIDKNHYDQNKLLKRIGIIKKVEGKTRILKPPK
jgi:hypothetical protein